MRRARRPASLPAAAMLAAVLPVAAAGPGVAADPACIRDEIATAPAHDDDGFISMPVAFGDRAASLLVDTGSDAGLLTEEGAARLGLFRRDPGRRTLVLGTGGTGRTVPNVLYPDLRLGRLRLPGGSMPLGPLPGLPVVTPPVAGLLGADVLQHFDVELDLPHGRIGFWRVQVGSVACAPPPAWEGRFDTVPLRRRGARLLLDARLDGRPITALLDTGARSRILSVRAAARLGVDADRLGVDPGGITAGVDLHESIYHWHRFRSLTIGADTQPGPVLTVAPLDEPVDLLLGADWFAARDVWISYATNQMFVRPSPAAATNPRIGPAH